MTHELSFPSPPPVATTPVSAATTPVAAVRLYTAQSDGNVTTLSLTGDSGNQTLAVASVTAECETNPAALTLDNENGVLYCYDRGFPAGAIGSLNSFAIDESNGALTRISRVEAPSSGVWGEILQLDESGERVYIGACYDPGAVAVFDLDLGDGTLPGTGPIQTISPTIAQTGPVADRQEASHMHHVIFDPTKTFVFMPDLGGDRIRVYTYDGTGQLTEDEASVLTTDAGAGPRHGFFRVNEANETFFFFNGELSQMVYSYKVTYAADGGSGLTFEKVFEAVALGVDETPAEGASTSECAMSPDGRFLIVSHREQSIANPTGPSDLLSTWAINEDGTLSFVQNAPSGGWTPRHFSLNAAGDMLAVGHQTNMTVVIWKRDVASGLIVLEAEGGKVAEVALSGPVVVTIWDE